MTVFFKAEEWARNISMFHFAPMFEENLELCTIFGDVVTFTSSI